MAFRAGELGNNSSSALFRSVALSKDFGSKGTLVISISGFRFSICLTKLICALLFSNKLQINEKESSGSALSLSKVFKSNLQTT